jgi:hypothetical protein
MTIQILKEIEIIDINNFGTKNVVEYVQNGYFSTCMRSIEMLNVLIDINKFDSNNYIICVGYGSYTKTDSQIGFSGKSKIFNKIHETDFQACKREATEELGLCIDHYKFKHQSDLHTAFGIDCNSVEIINNPLKEAYGRDIKKKIWGIIFGSKEKLLLMMTHVNKFRPSTDCAKFIRLIPVIVAIDMLNEWNENPKLFDMIKLNNKMIYPTQKFIVI